MEMAKSIREIAEYVSSLEAATVPDIEELKTALMQVDEDKEMLGVLLGEKLDELLQETMQVREEGDQERERLEVVAREKKGLEQQLDQAERKKQVTEEGRERCKERLEKANRVLQEYKSEDAKVAELAAANPRLVQATKLLYTISRLTLDTKTGPGQVKGFVVNPLKEDVTAFDLSEKDQEVSSYFITNYIWDLIAAGVSPRWADLA